jgi:acyl-homoserine lactone acylase PvdQ
LRRPRTLAPALIAGLLLAAAPAAAAPEPQPYGAGDFGGFRDVLPPGANGLVNPLELLAFQGGGGRPPHNDDQLAMYRDLVYSSPGLAAGDLDRFFKDSTFGVRPEGVERRYSPRDDVTIVRDSSYGVPHIYGETRDGAMFGIGYATAENRLFFIDVFRHLGRAQLSSFVGGAESNRQFDREIWQAAPYREDELERQLEARPGGFEEASDRLRQDLRNYVLGINKYISEARLDPTKMPGEYAAIGRPQGPEDWKGADTVATAAVIGAIFGAGGGGELRSALVLQAARARFGERRGTRVWRDFRAAEDPEAPTTVHARTFPYGRPSARPRGVALPDPGSIKDLNDLDPSTTRGQATSNALLVSARESESGRPLAVFGPQTGYFAPQVLLEQDVHAPDLDARGVSFPGINLYVSLGHGRDYAWSATSAGQDMADTFAVDLCEPDGRPPTVDSMHYRFRGQCLPIDVLERTNSWQPSPADPTPAGSETLRAQRTALGIVIARATVGGRPVAYTRLRTTYRHETDSGLGFSYFNTPDRIRSARDFQRAASLIGFAFNWFYVDDRDIAYFNSGFNPERAPRHDPDLPVRARRSLEWRGFDPATNTARYVTADARPRVVNQRYLTSWNNKQARGTRAADALWGYGPVYRSQPLDDRVRRGTAGRRKMNLAELVNAMEDSATVDMRGDKLLPLVLAVVGRPRDPALRDAVAKLRAWQRAGAHRLDRNGDGTYEHADAVRIMDAWWPELVRAQFRPVLGQRLFDSVQNVIELDNEPNNHGEHLGSAYQQGWYGYVHKDLRAVLGRSVRGRYSRRYCGRGRLSRCRAALTQALRRALAADPAALYQDDVCDRQGRGGDQWCHDAIWFRPLGGVTQPLIHWQNRPTYQQIVEVQGHRPR